MRLLVGSIYADRGDGQREWLSVQRRFLGATTENFDHVVVVNDAQVPDQTWEGVEVISAKDRKDPSQAHLGGLNDLAECFRARRADYDYFLVIDNDAFPIRRGWLDDLAPMVPDGHIAIALRSENLEQRLHASILLATPGALDDLEFRLSECASLTGETEMDIMPVRWTTGQLGRVFPLMRSNMRNVHPTRCGVYYDMFYHHGSGTPNRGEKVERWMRGDAYWDPVVPSGVDDCGRFRARLMRDPEGFVAWLAGWTPDGYPRRGRDEPSMAWERDGVSFRKVGEGDLEDLMRLKMEVWESNHSTAFLNMCDQRGWLEGLGVTNPGNLVLMAMCDGQVFGVLKVLGIDWVSRSASVGWDVFEGRRGNGLGKRLVAAGVRFCVDVLGLGSLDAEILAGNHASAKCAVAAGFRPVGVRKARVWRNGRHVDSAVYEFVKTGRQ